MLSLASYSVSIERKPIIHDFSYTFQLGRVYCILGRNGSGKSSLAFSLMGHPRYSVSGGLSLNDTSILRLSPDVRSERGIYLSFQSVPEIPWIKLLEYLRTIYNISEWKKNPEKKPLSSFVFRRYIEKICHALLLDVSFLDRDLYVWFSWGEKRKIELLQIRLLDPHYIILDEVDAGLDIEAMRILVSEITRLKDAGKCVILITHNFHLLETITPDEILILQNGILSESWGKEIIERIRNEGYTTRERT